MINRLIKNFVFDEKIRSSLQFSDASKIRLNTESPRSPRIELKASASGLYPTDSDIFIETPLTNPNALLKWLKFEAVKIGDALPSGTSLGFKLKTPVGYYYWNGSAWITANLSNWMTEDQLNLNFSSFPIATIGSRSIGVVINLKTTDPKVSPQILAVKLLGEFDIDCLDDIIYESFIRKLNTEFRSTSKVAFPIDQASINIDLNGILENKSYNITGIRSVYNITDDALKTNNLIDSYTPGALRQDGFTFEPGTVQFLSSIPAGKLIEITFEYVPEIMVNTGQDYFEPAKFPSLVIEEIESIDRAGFTVQDTASNGKDLIRDIPNLVGVVQFSPEVKTLRVNYAVFTGLQLDQMRLSQDLSSFFCANHSLKSYGLDTEYDLDVGEKINNSRTKTKREADGSQDSTDTNIATGSVDILAVQFFHKQSVDVPLVKDGGVKVAIPI